MMYRLVRALWRAALFAFFRRIHVQGRERVPARGPVLIVANHTNAFVDPLLILTELSRTVSLTAKSTLRGNPLLGPLIRALKVIEFHRSQDKEEGADPRRNIDAFAACRARLAEGGCIVIFPEGVSHSDPALRPFKTGAARIALEFLEQTPGASLTIVPAGLHYEAKERFRSAAGVVFGEPFDAAAWRRTHPGADARNLTAETGAAHRATHRQFPERSATCTFTPGQRRLLRVTATPPLPLGWRHRSTTRAPIDIVHRLQDGHARLGRSGRPSCLTRAACANVERGTEASGRFGR